MPEVTTKSDVRAVIKELLGEAIAEKVKDNERKGAESGNEYSNFLRERAAAQHTSKDPGSFENVVTCAAVALAGAGKDIDRAKRMAAKAWGSDSPVVKALGSADAAQGGFLTIPGTPPEVIEFLRPGSTVRSLNPVVYPLDTGTLPIPRINTGAVAGYVQENFDFAESDQVFGDVVLSARELAAFTPVSNKLIAAAFTDVDALVRNDLVAAVGMREDAAFLSGDGSNNTPVGLTNWAAASTTVSLSSISATGNALANITTGVAQQFKSLLGNNVRMIRPGWLWHPFTEIRLRSVQDANGHYVFRDEMAAGTFWGYPFKRTTQLPTPTANPSPGKIILADFADVVIGQMSQIQLDVSQEAAYKDSTGTIQSAFTRNQTLIRIVEYHDLVVRHQFSVAVLTGVDWI